MVPGVRVRQWVSVLPRTARERIGSRPGAAPTTDDGWARLLRLWNQRLAEQIVADVFADADGRPVPHPNLNGRARRLWTLAHLRRRDVLSHDVDECLEAAFALVEQHQDPEFGGFRWSVEPEDSNKLLYSQSVAVLALAELAMSGIEAAPSAATLASDTLELATARVTPGGAVHEFLDRAWNPLPKGSRAKPLYLGTAGTVTLGGQLHLVEAAAALAEAVDSPLARRVGANAVDIVRGWFLSTPDRPDHSCTDELGSALDQPTSLGHKVEAAWLVGATSDVLGTEVGPTDVRRWVQETLDAGFRAGGLDRHPGERRIRREWWQQTELLRALVEIDTGPDSDGRNVMYQLLRWLHRYQIDPRTARAWQVVARYGLVVDSGRNSTTHIGYHDVRAYVAAAELLSPTS